MGRGLSALLKDPKNDIKSVADKNAEQVIGNVVELDIDAITVNPFQPRSKFNDEALEELAGSIRELGIIQPITVRKIDFNNFQLVSGERRYRASKRVGLKTIPAYIRIANDQESLEMALVENIQRQDLDPIEIALSYRRLIDEIQLTQERLSNRVGKKRATIANYLRLLKLHPIIQTGMRDGFISMGHGRALITIESKKDQLALYEKVVSGELSVRDTEQLVKRHKTEQSGTDSKGKQQPTKALPAFVSNGREALKAHLAAEVNITSSVKGKGKIVIPFHSKEEFQRLQKLLTGAS